MKSQPLIAVRDVEASSRWYCELLACVSGHGGSDYDRIVSDGDLVPQLHRWDAHHHPHLGDEMTKPYGNGVVLWFEIENFDHLVSRVTHMNATILEHPHVNKNANHREIWLKDLDGYVVVVAGALGE